MTFKMRPLYWTLALSLTVTGASYAFPDWTQNVGIDLWNHSQLELDLNIANRRGRDLDECTRIVAERLQYRETVIDELLEKRIDFIEAVSRFRFLCETQPEAMRLMAANFPADSVDEMVARQVWSFSCTRFAGCSDSMGMQNRLLNEAGELLSPEYVARKR